MKTPKKLRSRRIDRPKIIASLGTATLVLAGVYFGQANRQAEPFAALAPDQTRGAAPDIAATTESDPTGTSHFAPEAQRLGSQAQDGATTQGQLPADRGMRAAATNSPSATRQTSPLAPANAINGHLGLPEPSRTQPSQAHTPDALAALPLQGLAPDITGRKDPRDEQTRGGPQPEVRLQLPQSAAFSDFATFRIKGHTGGALDQSVEPTGPSAAERERKQQKELALIRKQINAPQSKSKLDSKLYDPWANEYDHIVKKEQTRADREAQAALRARMDEERRRQTGN